MKIEVTDEMVDRVATLASLSLADEERGELKEHFRKVLAYIAELQELDTDLVDPSHLAVERTNVYRPDQVRPGLSGEEALANAPASSGPHFQVPRIIADGGGGSA